jgi:hypothetical protein
MVLERSLDHHIWWWYRIPDSRRIVSCVSAAFIQYEEETHETHETGLIRVQIRDQAGSDVADAHPRNWKGRRVADVAQPFYRPTDFQQG